MLVVTAIFLASLIPAVNVHAQEAAPFVGNWNGNLSVAGMELSITLKISLDEEKKLTGTIDVPDQGAIDIPLAGFEIDGKSVTFIIDHPGVPGEPTFTGKLDETGKKLSGTFTQSGAEGEFTVEKE